MDTYENICLGEIYSEEELAYVVETGRISWFFSLLKKSLTILAVTHYMNGETRKLYDKIFELKEENIQEM